MARQQLQLRSPSGNRLLVDLPGDPRVTGVAAQVRFVGGSIGRAFQIGSRGYHRTACEAMVPAVDVDRFLVHDREVVVAESDDRNTSIATLIGEYHELMTVFAGPRPDRTTLRNLFGLLEITDHVEGMTVRPRSATMLDVLSEAMSVAVDGFGSLDVPGPHQSLNLRPAHRGQATRHGEVWRMTRPDVPQPRRARDYGFLLACEAGLAEVDLPHVEGATDAAALAWLDDIKVAWQKA